MSNTNIDYLILGPAAPFRGGISDTQHELASHLVQLGKRVELLTFSKLYPNLLFPGKTQKRATHLSDALEARPLIHAYNPLQWKKVSRLINKQKPRCVIFRYYTPFLAPVYSRIAKSLDPEIKRIALVDNWIPHEKRFWDHGLNLLFGKQMHAFTTLSSGVASQIKSTLEAPVWEGFHPINTHLLTPISKVKAREQLGWDPSQNIVLFFGLIREYKGVELLIQAFHQPELKDRNFVLKIVGECYENPSKYTDLVERLELQNSVHFDFEFKYEKEIQHLFSACDLVAQTYHTATQSGVTPMAYFYKKPLLVSDIEGLNSPIKKDQTGLCVQKNPQAIAEGIIQLFDSKTMTKTIENLAKAKENYGWSKWVKEWDHFIQKI